MRTSAAAEQVISNDIEKTKQKRNRTAEQKVLHKPASINISSVMRRPLETETDINKC